MIVWIDGALLPLAEARLSPLDRGLTVGDGVFETLRVYAGTPFAWSRHYDRLHRSATALGLTAPDSSMLRNATNDVLQANQLGDARLRITVTAGEGAPGSSRSGSSPTIIVVAIPFVASAPTTRVVVAPWTRNERGATAGLKTVSYAANVRALAYAEAHDATEALFANTRDNLCEATGSNVFVVIDGTLRTPPESAGCLLGVTRALVIELAARLHIECREIDVPMSHLTKVDEAFLSSSTRQVQAITHIDDFVVPHAPGVISAHLATAFDKLITESLEEA